MELLIAAIVLLLAGVAVLVFRRQIIVQHRPVSPAVGYVLLVAGVLAGVGSTLVIVPAGHVGVKVLFGEVQPGYLDAGLKFVNPLMNVEKLSVRTQVYTMSAVSQEGQRKGDDSIQVLSKGGLSIPLDVSVAWRLVPGDAPEIYRNLSTTYEEDIIRSAARAALRDAAQQYTAQEAYSSKREELAVTAKTIMEKKLAELLGKIEGFEGLGFVVQQVLLRNVSLPARLRSAIEEKLAAEQDAQRMEFVLQKEQKEAERKQIEAKGIAEFQRIVSEGISEQLLRWKGIEATLDIARSPNAKVVIIGGGEDGLPVILNTEK